MRAMKEPKSMAEIRKIREELSKELKGLGPGERAALIKKGAAKMEKKMGLRLPRQSREPAASK